ncbi:hypothetical protein LIER_32359 [Lithospermum erythrorhizon]|uniref:Uncharacterized protein n=1 Tax=Lithospermum erythrorhizon TaxID=34254 RepID=A0AAV3RZ01_LITER
MNVFLNQSLYAIHRSSDLSVWCFLCDTYLDARVIKLRPAHQTAYILKFGEAQPSRAAQVLQSGLDLLEIRYVTIIYGKNGTINNRYNCQIQLIQCISSISEYKLIPQILKTVLNADLLKKMECKNQADRMQRLHYHYDPIREFVKSTSPKHTPA